MADTVLPAAATLVALGFACATGERWLDSRARYHAAWTISLALFVAGSASLWAGAATGWNSANFRAFYLFGAILNVPVLALGTVYLLAPRRVADRIAAATAMLGALATGVMLAAPLTNPIDESTLPQGSDVFGVLPRVLAASFSGIGALVVFGGATYSALSLIRGRTKPRLASGNLLIAAGTLVLSLGGLLNSTVGEMDSFALSLVVGVALLFGGFLVASPPSAAAKTTRLQAVAPVDRLTS